MIDGVEIGINSKVNGKEWMEVKNAPFERSYLDCSPGILILLGKPL